MTEENKENTSMNKWKLAFNIVVVIFLLTLGFFLGRKTIETKTSVIAAQTVIVGKTPDAFTNVVESEKDNTGGLINDYGAMTD